MTVVVGSVIFYSISLWLALAGHFFLPGEPITRTNALGLALAFAGITWALGHRGGGGQASLTGDLFARGTAIAWVWPEMQLLWMVGVPGPVLIGTSLLLGPWIRALSWLRRWRAFPSSRRS